jgi:hypothetical protein
MHFWGMKEIFMLRLMIKFKEYLFSALALALALSLCGCGGETAPDPPSARSQLTLELFNALQHDKDETAISLIASLREIDKSNLFLAQLESLEKDNICITKIQKILNDGGSVDKAQKILEEEIKDRGRRVALVAAQKEIRIIAAVKKQVNILLDPENAIQVARAAVELTKIAKQYKPAKVFTPFIKEKISQAYEMEETENKRSLFDLRSDLRSMLENGDPDVKYLVAQLAVEKPNDSLVNQYVYFINEPSDESTFSSLKKEEN